MIAVLPDQSILTGEVSFNFIHATSPTFPITSKHNSKNTVLSGTVTGLVVNELQRKPNLPDDAFKSLKLFEDMPGTLLVVGITYLLYFKSVESQLIEP